MKIEKLKELKEISMMLNDKRQKGKITYKIWDIVVVTILAVLANCTDREEIADYAKDKKAFFKTFLKLTGVIGVLDSNELNKLFVEFIKDIQFMEDIL